MSAVQFPFPLHVARLADADQVAAFVCFFRSSEQAERPKVMDGQGLPNVAPAVSTAPGLLGNHNCTRRQPITSAICLNPSYPLRGFRTFCNSGFKALSRTVFGARVLANDPRRTTKRSAALGAGMIATRYPFVVCGSADLFGSEGVCGSKAFAPLVAQGIGRIAMAKPFALMPSSTAFLGTETRSRRTVGPNRKGATANLASQVYRHDNSIAKCSHVVMGNRTTGIAHERMRDLFREPEA